MRRDGTDDRWPQWLEPLRPDDLSRRRMLGEIMRRARPMLAHREPDWLGVAAGWATMLVPVAAIITLVFGGIAIQASGPSAVADGPATAVTDETAAAQRVADAEDLEYVLHVATMYEAP